MRIVKIPGDGNKSPGSRHKRHSEGLKPGEDPFYKEREKEEEKKVRADLDLLGQTGKESCPASALSVFFPARRPISVCRC